MWYHIIFLHYNLVKFLKTQINMILWSPIVNDFGMNIIKRTETVSSPLFEYKQRTQSFECLAK